MYACTLPEYPRTNGVQRLTGTNRSIGSTMKMRDCSNWQGCVHEEVKHTSAADAIQKWSPFFQMQTRNKAFPFGSFVPPTNSSSRAGPYQSKTPTLASMAAAAIGRDLGVNRSSPYILVRPHLSQQGWCLRCIRQNSAAAAAVFGTPAHAAWLSLR